jgi:uncharacterized protein (DUF58 family)
MATPLALLSKRPLRASLAGALGLLLGSWFGLGWAVLLGLLNAGLAATFPRPPSRRTLSFTRDGKVLIIITLGVGIGAINTGNNLLYLMLGMMLSLIIVSGVLSERTLRRLTVTRSLPRVTHARQPFLTGVVLHNRKRRIPSYSVQVEDLIDGRSTAKRCYFLKVPAGAEQETNYRARFERRGLYHYSGMRISTRFPFGFFLKARTQAAPGELLVLPRIHPIAPLSLDAHDPRGLINQPRRGQGREFHGLRTWRDGDDARDIHWRRSAREGRLILREYEQEGGQQLGIWLAPYRGALTDDTPEHLAQLDALVDQAASLLAHFTASGPGPDAGHSVTLGVEDEHLPVHPDGRGRDHAMRRLALAAFQPGLPEHAPALPPTIRWILVCAPGVSATMNPARFAHIFEAG